MRMRVMMAVLGGRDLFKIVLWLGSGSESEGSVEVRIRVQGSTVCNHNLI